MLIIPDRFALELRSADGRTLDQRPVEPDWEPAVECARFALWRKGCSAIADRPLTATIEPIAHKTAGEPYASGIRVTLSAQGERLGSAVLPLTYFEPQARKVSAGLIARGLLRDGDTYRYRLLAFARPAAEVSDAPMPAFKVAEVVRPPHLRAASFDALTAGAAPFGDHTAGDFPVFVPQHVIDEASALTEQSGAVETGGVLIGHLCRDDKVPDLGVQVAAQIPARHAEGELHKLTFTTETWAAVRAALELRKSSEIMLGWWHSHPAKFWHSPECPPERRRVCPLATNFFSEDDVCLHETVFGKAFQIALVVTHTDQGLQHAMFGWRSGMVRRRGFHVLNSDRPLVTAAKKTHLQGRTPHATPCP